VITADTITDEQIRPKRNKRALGYARDAAYQAWRMAKDAAMWLDDDVGGELLATARGAERQAWHAYNALVEATGEITRAS
jgi:hypothetical protein